MKRSSRLRSQPLRRDDCGRRRDSDMFKTTSQFEAALLNGSSTAADADFGPDLSTWTGRTAVLWQHRVILCRLALLGFALGLSTALLIPRRYTSAATVMPPDQSSSSALMLAALAGHTTGLSALSSMAGGLIGMHSSSAVFASLLHSQTIAGALIQRFDLKQVYRVHYQRDAAKRLAHYTAIVEDKKSGTVTISVQDQDPFRARDLAQAYLDELNKLVARTSISHARQERLFLEARLNSVERDLERAQLALSEFSSHNSMIDMKEQTRAIVDAGARVQGQLLAEQSGLQSLRQMYGDENFRVRQSEVRIATLQHQLNSLAGSSTPLDISQATTADSKALSPSLRQLPRLAVPFADLYRKVRVQESVYELLTEQYEMSRIAEARELPVISVIDTPGIPEKKSFPPRLLITLGIGLAFTAAAAILLILREQWLAAPDDLPQKQLLRMIRRDSRLRQSVTDEES